MDAVGTPAFGMPRHSFTVELWVQPEKVDGTARFLVGRADSVYGGWYVQSSDIGLTFVMTGGSPLVTQAVVGPVLAAGSWSHVVAVYDGSGADAMMLYVNDVASGPISGTPTLPEKALDFTIGIPAALAMVGTTGSFDEVAFYDYVLDPSRVTAHYAAR
jgi:hypothetical protein